MFCGHVGEVPFNHEILREANALCHRLPVLSTLKFKTDFYDVSVMHTHTPQPSRNTPSDMKVYIHVDDVVGCSYCPSAHNAVVM